MARSRNIKPGLFKNEVLGEADPDFVLLFAGLWTLADKEGRLEHRPKRIKAEIFPYRNVDVSMALAWLMHESFINMYEIDGFEYIQINNWRRHQSPHHKEVDSEIPPPPKEKKIKTEQGVTHAQSKHESSKNQAYAKESASSPLIPDSLNLIPDSLKEIAAVLLPTNLFEHSGEVYEVSENHIAEFQKAYPDLDIPNQLQQMRAKLLGLDKTDRRTKREMHKFISNWLQNRSKDMANANSNTGENTRPAHDTRKLSGAERTRQARAEASARGGT